MAAGDEVVLSHPGAVVVASTGWLVLGGTALLIAGHAAFKFAVWRVVPRTRLAAVVALGLPGLAAPALSGLGLGLCAAVVILAVAALDYRARPRDRVAVPDGRQDLVMAPAGSGGDRGCGGGHWVATRHTCSNRGNVDDG